LIWRRSYDVPPAPLAKDDPRSPFLDPRYKGVDEKDLPLTEALKNTVERILPYWNDTICQALIITTKLLLLLMAIVCAAL